VGEIVAVCMGPESAQRVLTKALALGADRAVLVTDAALAGSDIAATSYVLSTVLGRQEADLVILGQQAADGDCYVMAAAVADHMRRPLVTQVAELELEGQTVRAKRQAEHGYDLIEAPLPAVISVSDAINTPRLPSIKAIMGAKRKPLETLSAADLELDASRIGGNGSRSVVRSMSPPPERTDGIRIEDAGGDSADKVVAILAERGLL
jgi:electron transfer flavoprotein beta subunit